MTENRTYAYCRISKGDGTMHLENQIYAIEKYAKEHNIHIATFYKDECKGDTPIKKRSQLPVMLENLRKGDTVIVTECSRLYRNCQGLEETYRLIVEKKECEFITLDEKEQILCTNGQTDDLMQMSMKKIILTIMGTISEFEKRNISARTVRSLQQRKAQGQVLGRPRIEIPTNFKEKFIQASNGECTHSSVMKEFKMKKATYYNIAKSLGLQSSKKVVG